MNQELYDIASNIVNKLKRLNLKIATAESCTGGMVSEYITSVPGVSDIFELGITSYSIKMKHKVLGVNSETLSNYGAVSSQTAKEMAAHVKSIAGSDIGISVTGVAGPTGSEGKNPGTVYIALANDKKIYVEKLSIEPESRNFVRETTVKEVFVLINKYVEKEFSCNG